MNNIFGGMKPTNKRQVAIIEEFVDFKRRCYSDFNGTLMLDHNSYDGDYDDLEWDKVYKWEFMLDVFNGCSRKSKASNNGGNKGNKGKFNFRKAE